MAPTTPTTLTWAQTAALKPHTLICLTCGAELVPSSAWLRSLYRRNCRSLGNSAASNRYLAPLAARGLSLASAGA